MNMFFLSSDEDDSPVKSKAQNQRKPQKKKTAGKKTQDQPKGINILLIN